MTGSPEVRERSVTVAGLRSRAHGSYAIEAAVELLVRAFAGRFASAAWPWVCTSSRADRCWLDPEALGTCTGMLSGGEQRLLSVVAALTGGAPVSDLGGCLAGLDRTNLALVLAAFAHAGGSHEDSLVCGEDTGQPTVVEPGPLAAWPDTGSAVGMV